MNLVFTSGTRLYVSMMEIVITVKGLYVLQHMSDWLFKYSTFRLSPSSAHANHANILHLAGPDLVSHTSLIQPAGAQQGHWKGPEKGATNGDKATEPPPTTLCCPTEMTYDCCLRINGQQHAVAGRKSGWNAPISPVSLYTMHTYK